MNTPLENRFWAKVQKSSGCWLWTGTTNGKQRAMFTMDGKPRIAARVVLALCGVDVPKDRLVCHHCDNPMCVKPEHLFIGTTKDNALDAVSKGRLFNQKKTHCKHGHPFTPENTIIQAHRPHKRFCRTCQKLHNVIYRQRRKGKT